MKIQNSRSKQPIPHWYRTAWRQAIAKRIQGMSNAELKILALWFTEFHLKQMKQSTPAFDTSPKE